MNPSRTLVHPLGNIRILTNKSKLKKTKNQYETHPNSQKMIEILHNKSIKPKIRTMYINR